MPNMHTQKHCKGGPEHTHKRRQQTLRTQHIPKMFITLRSRLTTTLLTARWLQGVYIVIAITIFITQRVYSIWGAHNKVSQAIFMYISFSYALKSTTYRNFRTFPTSFPMINNDNCSLVWCSPIIHSEWFSHAPHALNVPLITIAQRTLALRPHTHTHTPQKDTSRHRLVWARPQKKTTNNNTKTWAGEIECRKGFSVKRVVFKSTLSLCEFSTRKFEKFTAPFEDTATPIRSFALFAACRAIRTYSLLDLFW